MGSSRASAIAKDMDDMRAWGHGTYYGESVEMLAALQVQSCWWCTSFNHLQRAADLADFVCANKRHEDVLAHGLWHARYQASHWSARSAAWVWCASAGQFVAVSRPVCAWFVSSFGHNFCLAHNVCLQQPHVYCSCHIQKACPWLGKWDLIHTVWVLQCHFWLYSLSLNAAGTVLGCSSC